MPSTELLEAARAGFPHARTPKTEREATYADLVRANVLIQNIKDRAPYDCNDVEYHDLEAIHHAINRAQEFTG